MSKRAYYLLFVGGTGLGAAPEISRLYRRMGKPFPLRRHVVDSDPIQGPADAYDKSTWIGLRPPDIEAMRANIDMFGHAAKIINDDYAEFLHREKVSAGSRARRALTQLFTVFHRQTLVNDFHQQILDLMSTYLVEQIQPVILGSSGGGCGSALSILIADMFANPNTRSHILAGFDDTILRRPIFFAADPYAKAERNNEIQQKLIFSNAFAFRHEAGNLQQHDHLADVYLTGLSNSRGVVLKTVRQLHHHLASVVFWHMMHEPLIDSIKANHGFTKYAGIDVPELAPSADHTIQS